MKKRLLSLLLALILTSSTLLSCSEAPKTNDADTSNQTDVTTTDTTITEAANDTAEIEESEEVRVETGLPENLDFEGHNFTIMNNDHSMPIWSQIDIGADEMTGEGINDAVYKRNLTIGETYNCTVESAKTGNVQGDLSVMIKAGDDTVDLATVWLRTFAAMAQSGSFIDLNTLDTLDLTKPWIDTNSVSEMSIKNHLYGVVNDLTLLDKQATTTMIFNKQLYEDYQFDKQNGGSLYDMVKNSTWTYDSLKTMVSAVSGDVDGNGVRDEHDLYGLLYQRDTLTSLLNGFDVHCAKKNADDFPELTLMTDYGVTVLDRIFDLLYQDENCLNVMVVFGENYTDNMVTVFEQNLAMFMWIRMADVQNLRAMDVDFGILPIPKYSENQDRYYISVNPYVGCTTCIPISNYNPALTAQFLTAIAAESHYTVLPEYYEVNLKGKVSRDEESVEMLDIIFSNRLYDLGQIFDPGNFANTLIYMTMTKDRDVASQWAKAQKMVNKMLDRMENDFAE